MLINHNVLEVGIVEEHPNQVFQILVALTDLVLKVSVQQQLLIHSIHLHFEAFAEVWLPQPLFPLSIIVQSLTSSAPSGSLR